jgi:5-methylcytosine-specific restriction endonuclease McrA
LYRVYDSGVAIPVKLRKQILERDQHCWHCGQVWDLVVHHRVNRGMGGSKLLDTPDNLMAVCARWNGDMESDADVAAKARGWGHKLPAWEALSHPVYDVMGGSWWVLLPDGSMVESDWRDQPF